MPVKIGDMIKDYGPTITALGLIVVTWIYVDEVKGQSRILRDQVNTMRDLEQKKSKDYTRKTKIGLYTKLQAQQQEIYQLYAQHIQTNLELARYNVLADFKPGDSFNQKKLLSDIDRHSQTSDRLITIIAEKKSQLIETLDLIQMEFAIPGIENRISLILKASQEDLIEETSKQITMFTNDSNKDVAELRGRDGILPSEFNSKIIPKEEAATTNIIVFINTNFMKQTDDLVADLKRDLSL